MSKKIRVPAPFMAGDYIGAGEWRIMRILEEEEAEAAQHAIVERMLAQPTRIEVLA